MIELKEIEQVLKRRLSERSFNHSVRTKQTAIKLSEAHGTDVLKTSKAALLHDYARDLTDKELLEAAARQEILLDQSERNNPYLLHAPVGAILVKSDLGITDEVVLSAIRRHTYGDVVMNKIDMIVYLADLIEPGRSGKTIEDVRMTVFFDLEGSFKAAYKKQVEGLLSKGKYLHPFTIKVWNSLIVTEKDYGRTGY